ncbi:unnamed protein product [Didymodactylos carnosus]|uniref:Neurotransmitter-gated ion-channel transmembrane domain-containing protein n=1 Tax=Didymodactylos carnosus TaxID=1234261 RepID=A0A814A9I1_9BILA|nr:unnamed protein product [Didymodactylos carnosus]CAF0925109.1 unnamed protein product [Didymodactylos carnosus]CAF3691191.1 unnamed protein product [Didymodactylos carnosus]CAF3702220.1 unnamed protein product [Didymodactylos carnosus]
MPSNAEHIPRIGAYYCLNMGMIATSSFLCAIVVHIYFRGDGPMPNLLRKIFLEWLARFFRMVPYTNPYQQHAANGMLAIKTTCDGDKFEKFELLKERFKSFHEKRAALSTNNHHYSSGSGDGKDYGAFENDSDHISHYYPFQQTTPAISALGNSKQEPITELNITFITVETDLKEIRDYLRTTRKRIEDKEVKAKLINDWRQLALVLDRALFFIYLSAIIISLAVMFPR